MYLDLSLRALRFCRMFVQPFEDLTVPVSCSKGKRVHTIRAGSQHVCSFPQQNTDDLCVS